MYTYHYTYMYRAIPVKSFVKEWITLLIFQGGGGLRLLWTELFGGDGFKEAPGSTFCSSKLDKFTKIISYYQRL